MDDPTGRIDRQHLLRRLERAAGTFDDADVVQQKTFDSLMERLDPVRLRPAVVLDLGAGTGRRSRALSSRYRRARVLSLDLSPAMLSAARGRRSRFSRVREIRGSATRLPLRDQSVDLVVANLSLPWVDDWPACFAEVSRVLAKGGVFAFATLGPDSLGVLRAALGGDGPFCHVRRFVDMHILGDALVAARLADPVLDVDRMTVTFAEPADLFRDLTALGARNSLAGRRRSLTGRRRWQAVLASLRQAAGGGRLAVGLELVYGHAFGRGAPPAPGEFRIEAAGIAHRQRSR